MRKVFGLQLYDPRLVTDEIIEERFQIAEHAAEARAHELNVPHLAPRLGEITCPVFGLWGVNDKFCPVSGAMRIAESCKSSRVMLLSECGHWVMVEHTDALQSPVRRLLERAVTPSADEGARRAIKNALGDELYDGAPRAPHRRAAHAREPGITIDDAYWISRRLLERRVADGEQLIGKKIGVTSKAVQRMLDVHQPDFG